METRMVSWIRCASERCAEHCGGDEPCAIRRDLAALQGHRIIHVQSKLDYTGNIEALELVLNDGQVLCIEAGVDLDRIAVSIVNG